ncbi:MAG TPA: peptidoglycan recognition family protein, partial [Mycobacteriales bacterium]|nr:peptidoglycan recognition family protein [Mycobacteriales bacterium]
MPILLQTFAVQAAGPAAPAFVTAAQAASQSTQVPLSLIEATAYVNTRWEWINTASLSGGVGPMNVTPDQMSLAISLSGHAGSAISTDLTANLEAGASLLAHYHTSGSDLASWSNPVATTQGPYVADEIYAVLRTGASRTLSTGESVTLAPATSAALAVGVAPNVGAAAAVATCAATSPDFGPPACWVAADPGNFSVANRGHDYPVDMIIVHDIEGSYGSAIQVFQRPGFEASAHYVVSYGGDVTQMVREHDIAWHAGNWDYNTRAIGIEHEGFAWTPGLYTTAEYDASA